MATDGYGTTPYRIGCDTCAVSVGTTDTCKEAVSFILEISMIWFLVVHIIANLTANPVIDSMVGVPGVRNEVDTMLV